jgi:hypothetical protein
MKKFLLIIFLMVVGYNFSQNTKKVDSTEICFPYQVGQKILIDLNEGDKNKELLKESNDEIKLLNSKIEFKDSVINSLKKQADIDSVIINNNKLKFTTIEEENKDLKKDIKILKIKNTFFNILSTSIIGGLTYVLITK